MVRKWRSLALVGMILLSAAAAPAQAEWGLYNPFASQPKPTTRREPSALAKLGQSTQQMFSKTADFLNPFNDADDKPQKKEQGSFWGSLFGSAESEPLPAETVGDFMSLPRP